MEGLVWERRARVAKRNQTNSDTAPDGSVSQQQQTAIDLIVSGKNLQETADAIGVQRPTVSHWLNHHPPFIAALNSRRQEAFDSMVERLRGLLPQALDVIEQQLKSEQPLPAALAVLKSCGLTSANLRPTGPTTVEAVEQEAAKRDIDRALTAISADDVQRAQRAREQQRLFAELTL